MSTLRDTWRKNWLAAIAQLTSIDMQRTSWLDERNQNPHWSFVEFMCCYFDDVLHQEEYPKHVALGFVSSDEFDAIRPWHELLSAYRPVTNSEIDRRAILDDPKWLAIVELGNATRERLYPMLCDEEKLVVQRATIYPGPSKWP